MSLPHICRCVKCGAEGIITPNPLIVPTDTNDSDRVVGMAPALGADYVTPYASSRADELAPRFPPTPIAICTHGFTVCMVCKFPSEDYVQIPVMHVSV